jgi:hypothetical protein
MTKVNSVGISLPAEIISKIDAERGDVPRSRYILRVLQDTKRRKLKEERSRNTTTKNINNSQDSPDRGIETPKARRIIETEPIGAHATI